ncbi:MAG TPA: phytanoyl-CoA dioxygenase family protein [Chthonomonadaceae bacterium]|nr:phytanoyl-CoA dioxygenase family protein [Chthonomonadaceae bacterium]
MSLGDQYNRDGYVIVRNVVDAARVAEAKQHALDTLTRFPDETPEQVHARPLWFEDPFYHRFVNQPQLIDLAEAILGSDLALFATGYIIKPPAAQAQQMAILWHQDGSYWPLDPMEVCTIWVALTPSTPANGCMRVIPGTQHMCLHEVQTRTDVRNLLNSGIDNSLVDESRAVDMELQPGDVSIHHPNIIHGSNANTSRDQWRINLVIRVISAHTRVTNPDWKGVFHLRGRRREDLNTYLPTP